MIPQEPFTIISNKLIFDRRLKPIDKIVYMTICQHAFNKKIICNPTLERIAFLCGVSRRYVQTSIKRLIQNGYFTIEHTDRRSSNNYILTVFSKDAVKNDISKTEKQYQVHLAKLQSSDTTPVTGHSQVDVNGSSLQDSKVDVNFPAVDVNSNEVDVNNSGGVDVNGSSQEEVQDKKYNPRRSTNIKESTCTVLIAEAMTDCKKRNQSSNEFSLTSGENPSEGEKEVVSSLTGETEGLSLEEYKKKLDNFSRADSVAPVVLEAVTNESLQSQNVENVIVSVEKENSTLTVPCVNTPMPETDKVEAQPVSTDDDFWTNWDKQMNKARTRNDNPINSLADFEELFGDKK